MTKSRAFIQQGSKHPDGLTREYSGTIYRPGQVRCLVTMSLCFLEAFQEKQKGEYYGAGIYPPPFRPLPRVEHKGDDLMETDWDLLETDLFGYSVRCWSLRIDYVKGNSI
jgi:hypothetical protein